MIYVPDPLKLPPEPKVVVWRAERPWMYKEPYRVYQWAQVAGGVGTVVFQATANEKMVGQYDVFSATVNSSLTTELAVRRKNIKDRFHQTTLPEGARIDSFVEDHLRFWFGNDMTFEVNMDKLVFTEENSS